ncbi:hypothetical protein CMV_006690 [Castanea mollissima]|uniref:Uncharacterized protein n=1 Tax=Castanea mollissima TaxID=60419 RepID=A0A8J4RNJ3_9ROSI|nr:hypothetical protein CMV_006690 [Castanea mollissima]
MVKSLRIDFCGNCSQEDENTCNYDIISIFPAIYTCTNHRLVFSLDLLLVVIFLHVMVYRSVSRKNTAPSKSKHFSPKLICSAIYNGGLELGIWIIVIIKKLRLPITTAKLCYIAPFLFAGFLCFSSFWVAIVDKRASIQMVLDILSFPGAILLVLHQILCFVCTLPGEEGSNIGENCSNDNVTPFAKAGFLSKMSIWWLNPLTKHNKDKIFQANDIPQSQQEDQAQTCYLIHFFLKAFIEVAKTIEAFKYESYALVGVLFLAKCFDSLSERQWFFQTRLIGLQVNPSPGEIMNCIIVDAYRIGEFLYWFHQHVFICDLKMLPVGDQIEIGVRGVTLSGGEKQWVQLAHALYQDVDVYLLDDPFNVVDAHTATSLFNVMTSLKDAICANNGAFSKRNLTWLVSRNMSWKLCQ